VSRGGERDVRFTRDKVVRREAEEEHRCALRV
jgi:hypothetical protein